MADILPTKVAQGKWGTIDTGHLLIPMQDGNVLDWQREDGSWRLWPYDPLNTEDVLPGPAVNSGTSQFLQPPHYLVKMKDGRVLDWVDTGGWALWNYDPKPAGGIFPNFPASGKWGSIKNVGYPDFQSHRLIPMSDGKVLDWGPREQGAWRLWGYDPAKKDILLGPIREGKWPSILAGQTIKKPHRLIPMADGRVLDWVPSDGSYRLWDYQPTDYEIFSGFPDDPVAQDQWAMGKWGMSASPGHLVVMQDGRILAWVEATGEWGLWEYSLPDGGGGGTQTPRWFAEMQPLARLLGDATYAMLTKPRPPTLRVSEEVASLVRNLGTAERRVLSEHLKALKEYVDAIEGMLGKG